MRQCLQRHLIHDVNDLARQDLHDQITSARYLEVNLIGYSSGSKTAAPPLDRVTPIVFIWVAFVTPRRGVKRCRDFCTN